MRVVASASCASGTTSVIRPSAWASVVVISRPVSITSLAVFLFTSQGSNMQWPEMP